MKTEYVKKIVLIVAIALIFECAIFNYQFWWSTDENMIDIPVSELNNCIESERIVYADYDKNLIAVDPMQGDILLVFEPKTKIDNLLLSIKGVGEVTYFTDLYGDYSVPMDPHGVDLAIYKQGKNDNSYEAIYDGVIYSGEKGVTINLPGIREYNKLILKIKGDNCGYIFIDGIKMNVQTDFCFSIIRFIILIFTLIIIFFYENIKLYMSKSIRIKDIFIISSLMILILGVFLLSNKVTLNRNFRPDSYNVLAQSLLNGKITVLEDLASDLAGFENPYDYNLRAESGVNYCLDYAYYKGHYYVYFGIVPCLIFYVPWHFFTGRDCNETMVLLLITYLTITGICAFVKVLFKRYFNTLNRIHYYYSCMLLVLLAMIPAAVGFAWVYVITQMCAILFIIWGMYFYTKAGDVGNNRKTNWQIALGSLLMALSAGCRPQLTFVAIISYPLLRTKMLVKEKRVVGHWFSFIVPYILVAIPLMYYNYIRFGSVTDFGSKYNLTYDTIIDVKFSLEKCIIGIKYFLLDLPIYIKDFPFVLFRTPDYIIDKQVKPYIGGYFFTNIIALFSLIPFYKFRTNRTAKENELVLVQYGLLLFTLFIVVLDTTFNGCIERYKIDFGIFLGISTIISISNLAIKEYKNKWFINILLAIGLVAVVYTGGVMLLYPDNYALSLYNKELYQTISRTVMFWI